MFGIKKIIILVVVLLVVVLIFGAGKEVLLALFSEDCGGQGGLPVTFKETCNCEGYQYGVQNFGGYSNYCVGSCGHCVCEKLNTTTNSFEKVDCNYAGS